jgi:hypothetical protein
MLPLQSSMNADPECCPCSLQKVEYAKNLKNMDFWSKMDPYAIVELGTQRQQTGIVTGVLL